MAAGQYGFNCAAFRSMPSSNFAGVIVNNKYYFGIRKIERPRIC
jgi:hypothetical protein